MRKNDRWSKHNNSASFCKKRIHKDLNLSPRRLRTEAPYGAQAHPTLEKGGGARESDAGCKEVMTATLRHLKN